MFQICAKASSTLKTCNFFAPVAQRIWPGFQYEKLKKPKQIMIRIMIYMVIRQKLLFKKKLLSCVHKKRSYCRTYTKKRSYCRMYNEVFVCSTQKKRSFCLPYTKTRSFCLPYTQKKKFLSAVHTKTEVFVCRTKKTKNKNFPWVCLLYTKKSFVCCKKTKKNKLPGIAGYNNFKKSSLAPFSLRPLGMAGYNNLKK